MDSNTLELVRKHGFGSSEDGGARLLRDMLPPDPSPKDSERPPFLLVETQGSDAEHYASKMDSFLTRLYNSDVVSDGYFVQDAKQLNEMWRTRESCNPSVAQEGCVYKYGVSVLVQDYAAVAREVRGAEEGGAPFRRNTGC